VKLGLTPFRKTEQIMLNMTKVVFVGALCWAIITAGCIGGRKEPGNVSTPMAAVINGDLAQLERLESKGTDLNAQYPGRFNWTVLMAAIYFQRSDIITNLLDHKVDVRKRDSSGNTALMWAIALKDTNTVALLVNRAPEALRESEDWSKIAADIQADSNPERWHGLLDQFLDDTGNLKQSHH
jgi:ankyrin repeat protein